MSPLSSPIARISTMLAGVLAIAITVLVPASYYLVSCQYIKGSLDAEAEIGAKNITAHVMSNPQMWHYEEVRLLGLLERRTGNNIPEARRVMDLNGKIIVDSSDALRPPLISSRHAIYDAGKIVAQLEISRSQSDLLIKTAL